MPPHASAPPVVPRDDRYAPPSDAACEVLGRALDVILDDPTGWDQDAFGVRTACGTAFCLAGHVAVTVLGYAPVWSNPVYVDGYGYTDASLEAVVLPSGERVATSTAAATALDLVLHARPGRRPLLDPRAGALFAAGLSLRRMLDLAFLYTQGRVDRFAAYARLARTYPAVAARDAERDDPDYWEAELL